jgi:hypothetical protein
VRAGVILKPYERRQSPGPVMRAVLGSGLVLFAAFYGLLCTILPVQLMIIPGLPILILIGMSLWLLPDIGGLPIERVHTLLIWFLALNILWPGYVAIAAPGLPWVTPTRGVLFALLLVVVFNLATSQELRSQINDAMGGSPILRRLFWIFWGLTTVSILFSGSPSQTLNKYVNNQIYWTMLFAISTWLTMRTKFVAGLARVLAWTVIVVSLMAIYEFHVKRVVWLDHLPSFLKVDAELLATIGDSQARAGTEVYRARGPFAAALFFAEYLAMAFPFVLHLMLRSKEAWKVVVLGAGAFAVCCAMYMTNSRSAMIGMLLSILVYGFMMAWRTRSHNKSSLVGTTVVLAYPTVILMMVGLVLSWNRLRVLVLGGGQNAASDDARKIQWVMGMPHVYTHPLGHGVGRAADVLGFRNPAGELTIDSYYLSLLIEYGPLGLLTFLAIFATASWLGFRYYNRAETEDELILAPMTMALFNFLVIKAALSAENNMPVAFIILGAMVGIFGQIAKRTNAAPAVALPPAARLSMQ